MPWPISKPQVTIAASGSLSGAVLIGGSRLIGIIVPSGWDAADITFNVSIDDGATYYNLYEETSDTEVTVQAAASRHIWMKTPIRGVQFMKVRSGTSGSPVTQNADRTLTLIIERDIAQPNVRS